MPDGKQRRFASFPSAGAVMPLPLLLMFVTSSPHVDACSPPLEWQPPMTVTQQILLASDLLYGRVLRTFPEKHGPYSEYTAEMEIYCVLKGRRTDRIVNITGAGVVQGHCDSSNLTVGNDYVITVSYDNHNGLYQIDSSEIDVTEDNLRQISKASGLQRVYPKGVEESTASVKCPVPAPTGHVTVVDLNEKSINEKQKDNDGIEVQRGRAVIGSCAAASLVSAAVVASLTVTFTFLIFGRVSFTF